MTGWTERLWGRSAPVTVDEAGPSDAPAFSTLHAAGFRRGWGEHEMERLLTDRAVVAHRARRRRAVIGFILSRRAQDEAEILSVAVKASEQGTGVGRRLLDLHLRSLAQFGVARLFLEVAESNAAARKLYAKAGFHEVGRRPGYYGADSANATALVLRRDLD
jgi:ribosomal-protein-alanine N-acetyltransferase